MEDMSDIKDSVDDYLDRNQEAFDEFANPDDVYYDLIEQLDSLEVCACFSTRLPPQHIHLPMCRLGKLMSMAVDSLKSPVWHNKAAPNYVRRYTLSVFAACMHIA